MIEVYQACLNILTKLTKFLGKKTKIIPGPLVKAPKVTQDQYDKGNMIKLAVALKDQNRDQYV